MKINLDLNVDDSTWNTVQETLNDVVGEEYTFQIKVWTNHKIGNGGIGRYCCHLILAEFNLLAVHHGLYLAVGTYDNGAHGNMSRRNFSKLLHTVDDDDVLV